MVNKNKWIINFNNLEPKNQLLVADAIIEELIENERIFSKEEYDKEKSEIVRDFLKSIKLNKNNLSNVLEKYENLSQKNKEKIVNDIFEIILKYLEIQNQEDKEEICQKEGHTFGKWKKITWITKEVYWDAGPRGYIDVEHNRWERTCDRCGFIEKSDDEPQELIDARNEKKKKAKIKKLERELKKLKEE